MAEQKTWTQEEFKKEYGPFTEPLDLPKGAIITEVTSKNGQVTFKYERTDKFAEHMEQREQRPDKFAQHMEQKRAREVAEARASLTPEPPKQVYQEWVLNLFPHLRETEPVTWHRVGDWKEYLSPSQFAEKYGTETPQLPEGAEIMYVRQSGTGYELRYQTPAKTVTEQFVRVLKEPMIEGYGESDIVGVSEVHGKPVGGDLVVGMLTFPVMLGEATIGEFEEHVMKQPTARSELMTPEQLALSYGVIATVVGAKYGPRIAKAIYGKVVPSHVQYVLSQKAFALKMRTTIPFHQKVISPIQLRLEHVYHEAIYKTPEWLGKRLFGPQRYGEVRAVMRTPFGTYESFDYPFPWKATPLSQYGAWLEMKHAFTMARRGLEKSLTWDIGLAPGYPVSAEKILATIPEGQKIPSLTLEEKMQQAERIPIYKTELTQRMSIIDGELKRSIYTWSTPTGDKTIFTRRGAFEFEQATQMDLPSRLFVPKPPTASATTWPSFRGIPSTPFDVTLQRAITKEVATGLGGLAFSQISTKIVKEFPIQAPSPLTFHKARTRGIPQQDLTPISIPSFRVSQATKQILKISSILSLVTLQKTTQALSLKQVQALKQKQIQAQGVMQIQALKLTEPLKQMVIAPTIRPPPIKQFKFTHPTVPMLPRKPLRSTRKKGDLRGAWFKKVHPLKTHQEMRSLFFGSPKRKRGKRATLSRVKPQKVARVQIPSLLKKPRKQRRRRRK